MEDVNMHQGRWITPIPAWSRMGQARLHKTEYYVTMFS